MMRLIVSIILFVLAGGIFMMYTRPTYDSVQADQATIAQYNDALSKAAELQQLKQTLLARYNAFDPNNITKLQKLLPDNVDNIGLILDLSDLASQYGLALQNVNVSAPSSQGSGSHASAGTIGASSQQYNSLTLTFSTQGTYSNFVQFLTELESSLRILDVQSLTIATNTNHIKVGGQSQYTYNMTLRTYWLK